ncbi:hypothetical protein G5714_002804 [Onychostoma macrolepis]|uniref:Uncharacterized protein n=1 Tax=Onychostoma macrolepis TaxID=369639 RepID=A0A7J6D8F9_9TELE|nr:hypothetical protein G5714_002804 [Onychostoma macrolepis]
MLFRIKQNVTSTENSHRDGESQCDDIQISGLQSFCLTRRCDVISLRRSPASVVIRLKKARSDEELAAGMQRALSPERCWEVLESAENDVLKHINNLMIDWRYIREMTREQELLLVYFLEALVMLTFLQEPEVVKKMTVSDWLKRTYTEGNDERVMVGVDECNAFFVLSKQEEAWFDVYYQYLRSVMIKRRHRRCSLDEAEKFFMYSSGNPVDNPCEDLKKLHDEYHLPSVTTDMVRSSVHTAVHRLHLTDDEKLSSPAEAPEAEWMNENIAFYLLKMSHP